MGLNDIYDDPVEETPDTLEVTVPPDHPASVEQCDHLKCDLDSPGKDRLCTLCTEIMLASNPNECEHCGTTLLD